MCISSESSFDPEFIRELNKAADENRIYRSERAVWGVPDLELCSWRIEEVNFFDPQFDLPTRARGLFTCGDHIVIRGYDKFFELDEVKDWEAAAVQRNTRAPYFATLKEDGSLVLISGYKGQLVVTSKYSSGSIKGCKQNFPQASRERLLRQLAAINKTDTDLADELERREVTALAELCDDSFDQHVLSYPAEIAGLYLTGLNHNTQHLSTAPPAEVDDFGKAWGFRRVPWREFPDWISMQTSLNDEANQGTVCGRPVEGYVVRTHTADDRPFFFKFKFDTTFTKYREWRMATKQYLKWRENPTRHSPPLLLGRQFSYETREYLKFVGWYTGRDNDLCRALMKSPNGLFTLREAYLHCKDDGWRHLEVARRYKRAIISKQNSSVYAFAQIEVEDHKHPERELARRAGRILETEDTVAVILNRCINFLLLETHLFYDTSFRNMDLTIDVENF